MVDLATITEEEIEEIERDRKVQLGNMVCESQSINPVIQELRYNYGYLYLQPYLMGWHGQFEIYTYEEQKRIHLAYISVHEDKRRQGYGAEMMTDLINLADKYGYIIDLTIEPKFGVGKRILKKFYEGFGFKKDKYRDAMIRYPQGGC